MFVNRFLARSIGDVFRTRSRRLLFRMTTSIDVSAPDHAPYLARA